MEFRYLGYAFFRLLIEQNLDPPTHHDPTYLHPQIGWSCHRHIFVIRAHYFATKVQTIPQSDHCEMRRGEGVGYENIDRGLIDMH